MKFRPCIDIHDGQVKQIVGGSLTDGQGAAENFVSVAGADFYGFMYAMNNLEGGHIILLNKAGTPEYEADCEQARKALKAFPGGFMVGGGVTDENANGFIRMGAKQVLVTSFVFKDGKIDYDNLKKLMDATGRQHIVLDLSCRKKEDGKYYIVTDRWQKFTDTELNHETLTALKKYCVEYLIHAVDVEGKKQGVDKELLEILGSWENGIPITYAGGVSSFEDLDTIKEIGRGKVDATIGSALSIFGGDMDYNKVLEYFQANA